MQRTLINVNFDEWLVHVFGHAAGGPQWYIGPDVEYWEGPPSLTMSYLTRLFEDPEPYLASYSDEQLNQGFWYLVNSGQSNHMFALVDEQVPLEGRCRCIRSFVSLFEKLFAPRCSPCLSHLDEPGTKPLNSACYMWWDILPIHGKPKVAARRAIDEECLTVMESVLRLASVACQESALHGLGHWALYYPHRVQKAVDEFLATHGQLRPEVLSYAQSARRGYVQ